MLSCGIYPISVWHIVIFQNIRSRAAWGNRQTGDIRQDMDDPEEYQHITKEVPS